MDYKVGSTLMANYTRPKPIGPNFLPTVTTMTASYNSHVPPHGLTHSLNLPWRPSTYYKVAQTHPTLEKLIPTIPSTLEKIPPLSASNRTALFTRYSIDDWKKATYGAIKTSETWRNGAEKLRDDSERMVIDREQVIDRMQKETSKNIGERVSDIRFWKSEIKFEIGKLVAETNSLLETKKRLERALKEAEAPLQNAQECLYHREQRQGIDLVHDEVEANLLREIDIIKSCQERMKRHVEKANTQLGHNRAAQNELERDNSDKFRALRIDGKCFRLKNTSDGIAFHRGVENVDACVSTPETWAKFTDDNILRSQGERASSSKLRDDIDNLLIASSNEMWSQFNNCNVAFTNRIAETVDAKNRLQHNLAKTLQEIFNTEQTIDGIRRAISEKEVYMKVAQTRLDERTRRPNVELCRDHPQYRLLDEVSQIVNTIAMLKSRLRQEEDALQGLIHNRATLEHELDVKTNTLFIDQDKCMGMRRSYPTIPHLIGYI